MEKYSTPLNIREMQVKTIVPYHYISTRMAKFKKKILLRVGKDVAELGPLYVAGWDIKEGSHFEKYFYSLSSTKSYH